MFLYGLDVLGDGLKKASGGTLEIILEKLTSNKLMAILLGAGVTAVIQSSHHRQYIKYVHLYPSGSYVQTVSFILHYFLSFGYKKILTID